jgi:hypothetical protein
MDPDPAIFVIDLQDANHFSKIKSQKNVKKTVGIKVLLTIFCLMIRIRTCD